MLVNIRTYIENLVMFYKIGWLCWLTQHVQIEAI